MSRPKEIFTHHARRRWMTRFDDIGSAIEDEFAIAKPASPKVRRKLSERSHRRIRRQSHAGKPMYYVTRRCIFPCIKQGDQLIVTTVYYRRPSI